MSESELQSAVGRSMSHNEIARCEYSGTLRAMMAELRGMIDPACEEIDHAEIEPGDVDVWCFSPDAPEGEMIWRLRVTLVG